MLMLALEQESDTSSGLCDEDFDNIKKRYHQTRRDGTINYAFAGGGAVKLLLDAGRIREEFLRDPSVRNERKHKDLDLYAFNNIFGRKNPNPQDVCGVDFFGPLQKLDYEDSFVPRHGIFVELLKGYYFGFPLPEETDVRLLQEENKRYLTLSPEFLIASKVFSTQGIREGIDDIDVKKLLKKFKVNQDYLEKIARKTKVGQIVKGDVSNLEGKLEDGSFFSSVGERVREIYEKVIPFIEELSYNQLLSLLEFNPEELVLPRQKKGFVKSGEGDLCSQTNEKRNLYELCMQYILGHLEVSPLTLEDATKLRDQIVQYINDDKHTRTLDMAVGMNKVLSIAERMKSDDARIAYSIAQDISTTPYMHTKISRYQRVLNDALRSGRKLILNYEDGRPKFTG